MSHVGQVGQSCGILPVPTTPSILCVRPIPPVPCRTSGTVLWNETGRIPFGQFYVSYIEFVVSVGIVRIVLLVCFWTWDSLGWTRNFDGKLGHEWFSNTFVANTATAPRVPVKNIIKEWK